MKPKGPAALPAPRRRNLAVIELWTPRYRQRVVTDKRKRQDKYQCRTLYLKKKED